MPRMLLIFCCFLVLLSQPAKALELPKPDLQIFKDTWNKITGSEPSSSASQAADERIGDEQAFAKVWKNFSALSSEALQLATDSQKTRRTLLELLTAREPKYVRLLKKSQSILADSEAKTAFDILDELILKNKELQQNIVKLKTERISAPISSYNPMTLTKERIDKKIKDKENEIEENKISIENLQSSILSMLKKMVYTYPAKSFSILLFRQKAVNLSG